MRDPRTLLGEAREASKAAHAPYSGYAVGAALLTRDGTVFRGCNVENAAYGATQCAERTALCAAVAAGHGPGDFVALACVTRDGGYACGICRQALLEFAPDMPMVFARTRPDAEHEAGLPTVTPADLLPHSFGPGNLKSRL